MRIQWPKNYVVNGNGRLYQKVRYKTHYLRIQGTPETSHSAAESMAQSRKSLHGFMSYPPSLPTMRFCRASALSWLWGYLENDQERKDTRETKQSNDANQLRLIREKKSQMIWTKKENNKIHNPIQMERTAFNILQLVNDFWSNIFLHFIVYFSFYWSIISLLQCCASFCCVTKWLWIICLLESHFHLFQYLLFSIGSAVYYPIDLGEHSNILQKWK